MFMQRLKAISGSFSRVGNNFEIWAARYGMTALRLSLGLIFTLFGFLKFFPEVSPAQDLVVDTTHALFFGLLSPKLSMILVALVETAAGLCLLANRFVRFALWFVLLQFVAILSPLVLLTGDLFDGPYHAPNIVGQYILKDFILLAAVVVLLGKQSKNT